MRAAQAALVGLIVGLALLVLGAGLVLVAPLMGLLGAISPRKGAENV